MQHQRTVYKVTNTKTRNKIKFNKPRKKNLQNTEKASKLKPEREIFYLLFMKTLLVTEFPKQIVYNENANTLTPNRHASKNINNIVHSQHITLKS